MAPFELKEHASSTPPSSYAIETVPTSASQIALENADEQLGDVKASQAPNMIAPVSRTDLLTSPAPGPANLHSFFEASHSSPTKLLNAKSTPPCTPIRLYTATLPPPISRTRATPLETYPFEPETPTPPSRHRATHNFMEFVEDGLTTESDVFSTPPKMECLWGTAAESGTQESLESLWGF
ncbi:hypothetical protein B0H10DRAFT_2210112 [Mycena sp. CBHHK59/15]|nr:hypothetical protein B0H10DRAFT_2210112 [Mycena sp. CBHHK59/15]